MVTVGGCVVDKWGRQTDMLLLAAALRTEIGLESGGESGWKLNWCLTTVYIYAFCFSFLHVRVSTHILLYLHVRGYVTFYACVLSDLFPLCSELTSAAYCLVFVVRLDNAQTLGLHVSAPVWAGSDTNAWLGARGWLWKYVGKVALLKLQQDLQELHSALWGPPTHFPMLTSDHKNDENSPRVFLLLTAAFVSCEV